MRELWNRVEQISDNLDRILEKAELWQHIVDESPIAIALFTANMNFFLVNNAFLELTGYDQEELIDNNISMVLAPDMRKMHAQKEKEFASNPVRKINRHGLLPHIYTKEKSNIPVGIDLSYIIHGDKIYYLAFVTKI